LEYTIGEVAEITGLSVNTLRYYEKERILPLVKRGSKNRIYDDANIEGIKFICWLKNSGMTINELKQFVRLLQGGDETLEKRMDILNKQKERIQLEIDKLIQCTSMIDQKIEMAILKRNSLKMAKTPEKR
jgi:DNA-binding transcriptional MerR regulator